MKVLIGFLLFAAALPAHADKKKDDKKKDEGKPAAAAAEAPGDAALRQARELESRHQLDAALDAYKSAADALAGPAKGEALARLALLQDVRGVGDPVASAAAAAAADPDGLWPAIAQARARVRQKKADEAEPLAQKALAAGRTPAALVSVALVQELKGDLPAAEATFREALAAEAGREDAMLGLARVLRKSNRLAEAETLLKALIDTAPGVVPAYKEAARVKVALGRVDEAVGDAATAAALAENDPEAAALVREIAVAKALVFVRQNQIDFALQDLTRLRDANPDAPEVRVGLARAFIAKRDLPAAAAELDKAVALAPDSAEAHYQRGYLDHVLKQNAAAALPSFEKAVALDPANVDYRTHLGAVLAELQQIDRAEIELAKVTSTAGYTRPDAWIYLGGAYLGAKRYKEAADALDKALALGPEVQMANAYRAWTALGLKDADGFKKYGAKARALGYKDARFLQNLTRVEAGEPIK
jgi:tetratricopeptide (TPR) repeat protein